MIKGITIKLKTKTKTGKDSFNHDIFETEWVDVDNVLVGEPTTDEVTDSVELYGKHVAYTLAIPKGDTHTWTDTEVILPEPFAGIYRTIGFPVAGIDENIPLSWNKKVKLERYE